MSGLNNILLTYKSPGNNMSPLLYNETRGLIFNMDHPLLGCWSSLLDRIQKNGTTHSMTRADPAFLGLYDRSINNKARDKYSWFTFVYAIDKYLGIRPMFDEHTRTDRLYDIDRANTNFHYIISNMRWLDRPNNSANIIRSKPHLQRLYNRLSSLCRSLKLPVPILSFANRRPCDEAEAIINQSIDILQIEANDT